MSGEQFSQLFIQALGYSAAIFTVIGTVLTYYFGRKQTQLATEMKPIKRLTIIFESYAPLIQTDKSLLGEIKINYRKKTVKNLVNLRLKVTNSGNRPIVQDDYYLPLQLRVKGLFLDAYQISENISGIDFLPEINTPTEIITCKKPLFNPKESIVLSFTVTEQEETSAKHSLEVDGKLIDGEVEFINLDIETREEHISAIEVNQNQDMLSYLSNISYLLTLIIVGASAFILTSVILLLPSFWANVGSLEYMPSPWRNSMFIIGTMLSVSLILSALYMFQLGLVQLRETIRRKSDKSSLMRPTS